MLFGSHFGVEISFRRGGERWTHDFHFHLSYLHSVALDAALEISASGGLGEKNQLWPRVCGVIAYDTPVSRAV